jgi:hypothetical protein
MWHGLIEKLWRCLERRAQLLSQGNNEPTGWRQVVFNVVFLTLVILGGVSYLPTFIGAFLRGMWGTALLYSLIYAFGFSFCSHAGCLSGCARPSGSWAYIW